MFVDFYGQMQRPVGNIELYRGYRPRGLLGKRGGGGGGGGQKHAEGV